MDLFRIIESSETLQDMVIFKDPAYIMLSIAGAILSFSGMLHEIYKRKKESSTHNKMASLFKSIFVGGLLTPMYFMAYVHTGGQIVGFIVGFSGMHGVFNSFWFLLSLVTAWFSPLIWDNMLLLIKIKSKNRIKNEQ